MSFGETGYQCGFTIRAVTDRALEEIMLKINIDNIGDLAIVECEEAELCRAKRLSSYAKLSPHKARLARLCLN